MLRSATVVKAPRKRRTCYACNRWTPRNAIRLYGTAWSGGTLSVIWSHLGCIDAEWVGREPKLRALIAEVKGEE